MNRVVVTGMGIVCSLGNEKIIVKDNLINHKNKMTKLNVIKNYGDLGNVKIGFVEGVISEVESSKDKDKSELMAYIAIEEACEEAKIGLDYFKAMGQRVSLSLSTSIMGSDYIMQYSKDKNVENLWLLRSKAYVSRLAKKYNICGGCYTTSSACASGTSGLGVAFDQIYYGKSDLVLCGGTDHITDISVYGFHALDTLSKGICKPFDKDREGINLGEGSAFFIFEEYEHAVSRNATILAEVLGYGLSNDAFHETSPDPTGEGAYRTMHMAIEQSGLTEEDIDYVNAHGTGTKANDDMELKALKKIFKGNIPNLSSTKSLTGHCLGAAGSIEFAFSLMYMQEYRSYITYNSELDICEDNQMLERTEFRKDKKERVFLSNSFAFGGNDATIIAKR